MSASAWLRWPPCCWWASSLEFSAEYCDVVETSSTELRTSSQPAATQRSLQEDLNAPRARARSLRRLERAREETWCSPSNRDIGEMPAVLEVHFCLDQADPRLDGSSRGGVGHPCRIAERGGSADGITCQKRAQVLLGRAAVGTIHELAANNASAPHRGAQTDSTVETQVRVTIAVESQADAATNNRSGADADGVVVDIVRCRRCVARWLVGWQGRRRIRCP